MRKDNHVIVTKRRYSGVKILLILISFSLEFLMIMRDVYVEQDRFLYAFTGYLLLLTMLMGNSKSSKIYLRYEYILGLIIKSVAVNIVVTLYMLSVLDHCTVNEILIHMLWIIILNILSIIIIFILVNWYTKVKCPDAGHMLHIFPDILEREISGTKNGMEKIKQFIGDHEYVYLHNLPSKWRNRIMRYCFEKNKTVLCTANLSDVLLKASGLAQDGDTPVYYCTSFGVNEITARLKRMFDFGFSFLALIILSPVFLIVSICIKLEDGGSVIYKQVRCTKDMKRFHIYKFRSMVENSESDGAKLAVRGDNRLTKVGAVIRKYKIDELPQLINIIKGDMSVVGPRPERPEMITEAIKNTPEFVLRTKVKAGLTGYAQVRGYYNTKFKDKLLWDLMYIENFSLLLDLKIIIMTVFIIFSENIRDEE